MTSIMFIQILPYCLNSETYLVIAAPRTLSRNLHGEKRKLMMEVVSVCLFVTFYLKLNC